VLFLRVAVEAVGKLIEVIPQQRMFNPLLIGTRLQIALGHIGGVGPFVHQDVIPGLIFGRAAAGHLVIPVIGKLEGLINSDHHTPISEQRVMNDLPGMIFVGKASHGSEPLFGNIVPTPNYTLEA
jgi:hypothetical protein